MDPSAPLILLDKVSSDLDLYIGGLFTMKRKEQLQAANITHVLTVLRLPLDNRIFEPYKHLVIEVDDVEDENLLQYLPETNRFIQEGLDSGGSVFVHCAMGKSRSATCVIAYMIQKYHISPTEALRQLRLARPLVEPNEGFMQQLEMFHQMQTPADVEDSPIYQRWLYHRAVQESGACGQAPDADKIRFEDEHTDLSKDAPAETELRCRKCRRTLATSAYSIAHSTPAHKANVPSTPCSHHFVDPLSWMRPELEQGKLDGRLDCPNAKCNASVGKYAWQGMRCSCGAWVVPAISLAAGKVDEVRITNRRGPESVVQMGIRRGPGVSATTKKADGKGLL